MAPSSGWRMSAFPPLLGDKLTSGEHAKNDANDPTYDVVARACASEMCSALRTLFFRLQSVPQIDGVRRRPAAKITR
jgi:hypothetical protein